jgi:hypothetical protein
MLKISHLILFKSERAAASKTLNTSHSRAAGTAAVVVSARCGFIWCMLKIGGASNLRKFRGHELPN